MTHARLTREHTRLTRVARAAHLTRLLTSLIFIDITKTTMSGPQHMDGLADGTPHDTIEKKTMLSDNPCNILYKFKSF
jgi:hypothetical protein